MDPGAIRTAIADTLKQIPDVRPIAHIPGSIPSGRGTVVVVSPSPEYIIYNGAMGQGLVEVRLTLAPWVPFISAEAAFRSIDELVAIGPAHTRSIYQALMRDRTLGGLCSSLAVERVGGVQPVGEGDNITHLTCGIEVLVTAGRH
jgi:hypothetical protein